MEDVKKERQKIENEQKKKGKGKKQNKKGRHPQHFQKLRYFSKIKRCEKRGDTRIEHKRDVKHNSTLEKHFTKYKIGRKEINKGIVKNKETFQNEGFLLFQEAWKKHKTGDAKGTKNSTTQKKKRTQEKTFVTRRKENGTRITCF